MSAAAIANKARQIAFQFEDVDRRELLKELLARFRDVLVSEGHEPPADDEELTRQLELVLVRNQIRGDDFSQLEKSGEQARAVAFGAQIITLKHLHDPVVQKIDAANASFWAAKNVTDKGGPGLGLMERQRLKMWLAHAMAEIDTIAV